jgi:iron complex outermembrane receptor protein
MHTLNNVWSSKTVFDYRQQSSQSVWLGPYGSTYNQDYATARINPELDGSVYALNRNIQSHMGVMFSNETYDFLSPVTSSSLIHDANQQQYSAYGNINIPLINKISLSTSARYVGIDTHAQFFNNTGPEAPSSQRQQLGLLSLSLNNQFTTNTSGYIRRAMGYQLPFIDESNYTANPNGGFGLKATTSTSYETGIDWHNADWQTQAEAFIDELHNEIAYYVPVGSSYGANYNLPPTKREGLSLDAEYEPTLKWTFHVSTTLMNNRFEQGQYAGNEIPGASEILGDFSARYQFTKVWSLYGESQYTGSQYAQSDNTNSTAAIPSYWLFNIALNAEFTAWELSLRVDNITNTQYNLATFYSQGSGSNNILYYPAAGRTAMLQITYKLN